MEVPVIVEPVAGNGYRVTGAGDCRSARQLRSDSVAEAIGRLAEQVRTRVRAGAKLTEVDLAAGAAPWTQDAGYLHDEPLFEPWREVMEEYRRKLDEDPEAL